MRLFEQPAMEKVLHLFFAFSHGILAIPYKIEWEPGLHSGLKLEIKSLSYTLWLARLLQKFLYTLVCWVLFIHLLPKYLLMRRFDLVTFQCEWGLVSLFTLVHQWPHLVANLEVKQISSGVSCIIKTLQHRKQQNNQLKFLCQFY